MAGTTSVAPDRQHGHADGDVRLPYLPTLDGLRGVAVLAVLAYHGEVLDGGFLGVDLFFVLSGFLITSLLLVERREHDRISLPGFWGRRARRLLPALLVVLAAVAVYAATVADPAELGRIRADGFATLLYVANWHDLAASNSYWDLFAAPSPLAHTWSLAIEEQLYLLWPLVVVGLASRARRPADRVLAASLVGAVASALWLLVLYEMRGDATRVYLGTDTRVAAVLAGAALAAFLELVQGGVRTGASPPAPAERPDGGHEPVEHPLGLAGLVAVVVLGWMWWSVDGTAPFLYQGGFAVHGLASAVLVALLVHPQQTPLHRLFSMRPLVWVGLVSYGLYLWHWPIYVWLDEARTGLDGWTLLAVRVGVSTVAAVASYLLVERPIRTGRVPGRVLLVGLPVAALVVAAGLWLGTSGADDAAATPQLVDERPIDPLVGAPSILVAGDSLALNVASGLQQLRFEQLVTVRTAGEPRCSPLPVDAGVTTQRDGTPVGGCGQYASVAAKIGLVLQQSTVDVVVLAYGLPEVDVLVGPDGVAHDPCDLDLASPVAVATRTALQGLPPGALGVLVTTPPIVDGAAARTIPPERGLSLDELNDRVACHNGLLAQLAASSDRLVLLDLAAWVCPLGECRAEISGVPMRPDGLHFGDQSSINAGRWMLAQLDELGALRRGARRSGAPVATVG